MITSIDLTNALLYIEEHGALQEKARLLYILSGEKPPQEVVKPLLDKQNPDGGFPSRPKGDNPSSVDNTITALWQLDELGMLSSPPAERGISFLIASQDNDGSWDENKDLPRHDLPPWIQPGEMATRIYLTAYAAYWLALSERSDQKAFLNAVHFLTAQQDEQGQLPSYFHANWITTSVFYLAGEQNAALKGLQFLISKPFPDWEDSQIAWALDCLGRAGLPANHPFIEQGLCELANRKSPEGVWHSEDGTAYAASATISAIKAFKLFGKLPDF